MECTAISKRKPRTKYPKDAKGKTIYPYEMAKTCNRCPRPNRTFREGRRICHDCEAEYGRAAYWKKKRKGLEPPEKGVDKGPPEHDFTGMPVIEFCRDVLKLRPTRMQRKILRAIEARPRRYFVGSGHGIGKSHVTATAICWIMATIPDAIVILIAPTSRQLKAVVFREIRKMWNGNKILLDMGECLTEKLDISARHYCLGISTAKGGHLQGIHGNLFIFVDEANEIEEELWESIDSLTTGKNSLICIGNCLKPIGRFYLGFMDDQIDSMKVSSRLHPNVRANKELIKDAVTREWIEDFERNYASNPETIAARIDAIFPESGSYSLIPRKLFNTAVDSDIKGTDWPTVLSCDPARFGTNQTAVVLQKGSTLEQVWTWSQETLPETARAVQCLWEEHQTDYVVVDDDGLGGGCTDLLVEWGLPVIPFHAGGKAIEDEKYGNSSAEAWNLTKIALQENCLKINTDNVPASVVKQLRVQLTTRNYTNEDAKPGARMVLEKKKVYEKRTGLKSPDIADAWTMAIWQVMQDWAG